MQAIYLVGPVWLRFLGLTRDAMLRAAVDYAQVQAYMGVSAAGQAPQPGKAEGREGEVMEAEPAQARRDRPC